MPRKSIKDNIQLTSYDDLLGGGIKRHEGDITEMPLENLHTFKDHPFKVLDDEHMNELVESIKEKGVLTPAIVRKRDEGGYEIISGHRRRHACELAGLSTMPVIIKEMDDNDAIILMVDANIQRENILPSERAFALQMKMNAIKQQGKRTDLTSSHSDQKLSGELDDESTSGRDVPKLTSEIIGEEEGLSGRQVKRYIRLTNLVPGLLERVDNGKIGIMQAVDLSFIEESDQEAILSALIKTDRKMTAKQAKMLRGGAECKMLDEDIINDILIGKAGTIRTVTFSERELNNYFPLNMDGNEIKQIIIELVQKWNAEK